MKTKFVGWRYRKRRKETWDGKGQRKVWARKQKRKERFEQEPVKHPHSLLGSHCHGRRLSVILFYLWSFTRQHTPRMPSHVESIHSWLGKQMREECCQTTDESWEAPSSRQSPQWSCWVNLNDSPSALAHSGHGS